MIEMNDNDGDGVVEVDITVEEDDGVFLSVQANKEGVNMCDLFVTEPTEIDHFFSVVREAEAAWKAKR